jgi:AbrB family looped-hinge helix DNA binding protein
MSHAIKTTIDAAGRLVVPKPIRVQAGIAPGDTLTVMYQDGRIEIEPAPREVRIEEREGFRIAEPAGSYETLGEDTVRRTREEVRADRKGRKPRR